MLGTLPGVEESTKKKMYTQFRKRITCKIIVTEFFETSWDSYMLPLASAITNGAQSGGH